MKNAKNCSLLVILLSMMTSSTSLVAAEPGAISEQDISEAHVIAVNSNTVNGFVSIARGRNCVAENANGMSALLTCPGAPGVEPVRLDFKFIELSKDRCLADEGNKPSLKPCDITDPSQRWDALAGGPTYVKNLKTKGVWRQRTLIIC
ncbi:MAG: hypothetical protein ACMZI0_13945 [Symbiopectobacterium sp.]|uniref:hypothetical protein n=1 Tax=Symbiopectobacterium sp. TaxID=2952789 RepID=UPI0039EB1FAF